LVGAASLAFALLLSLVVLMLRARLLLQERQHRQFLSVWQPILMNAVDVASSDVPQLPRRDRLNFLLLWNHLHESCSMNQRSPQPNRLCPGYRSVRLEDVASMERSRAPRGDAYAGPFT
jgi:hypothetical protein